MLETLRKALEDGIGIPFASVGWHTVPAGDYGVVTIEGLGDDVRADGYLVAQVWEVTVDILTETDGFDLGVRAQKVMETLGDNYAYALLGAWYDSDKNCNHWQWRVDMVVAY